MNLSEITCDLVDQLELDRRYRAGQLTDAEAAAFESHYFSCDRCWALLERREEVRAGFDAAPSSVPIAPPAQRLGRRSDSRPWAWRVGGRVLAAAAAIGVIAIAINRFGLRRRVVDDATRGTADSVIVSTGLADGVITATWRPVPGADGYRVRLQDSTGAILADSEVTDTTAGWPVERVPASLRPGTGYWLVEALNQLRRPIARSRPTAVPLPPVPR